MKKFIFKVLLRVDGYPCIKGFEVYAADEVMARGILRGQSAVMGWSVVEIKTEGV